MSDTGSPEPLVLYSFISSFFSIVTFLGWTRLQATWIKPEVVATKNIRDAYTTGSSRLDPGFYGVRVVHICVFLSSCMALPIVCPSWYRVSDVLDLSLVSKRHITHVIVLTFKEIKHLSDCRTTGPSDYRTVGLSDYSYGPVFGYTIKQRIIYTKHGKNNLVQ